MTKQKKSKGVIIPIVPKNDIIPRRLLQSIDLAFPKLQLTFTGSWDVPAIELHLTSAKPLTNTYWEKVIVKVDDMCKTELGTMYQGWKVQGKI